MRELIPLPVAVVGAVLALSVEAFVALAARPWSRRALAVAMRGISAAALIALVARPGSSERLVAGPGARGVVLVGGAQAPVPAFVGGVEPRAGSPVVRVELGDGGRGASDRALGVARRAMARGARDALFVLGPGDDLDLAADMGARFAADGVRVSAIAPMAPTGPRVRLDAVRIRPAEPRARMLVVAVAQLRTTFAAGAQVTARWLLDGRLLQNREIDVAAGERATRLEHAFTVPDAGLHRLRVEVFGPRDASAACFFSAASGARRVLLLEGESRPVYRGLKRALDAAGGLMVRGECSAERAQGSAIVPRTGSEWSGVDAIVLGNLAAAELPLGFADDVARFVEAGGGLVVVAGERNLARGGWHRTPLGPVMPVEIGEAEDVVAGPFDARPSGRVGAPRPFPFGSLWAGLESPAVVEGALSWRELAELGRVVVAGGLAEGGSAPIVAARPGRTVPLVAWKCVGRGRCAVVLSDELWRWASAGRASRIAHDAFWCDLVTGVARASAVGGRAVWIEAGSSRIRARDELALTVYATDASRAVDVDLTVRPTGFPEARSRFELPEGSMVRTLGMRPDLPGLVVARASVRDGEAATEAAEAVVTVDPAVERPATPDSARLAAICAISGGACAPTGEPGPAVESFLRALDEHPGDGGPATTRTRGIPVLLLIAVFAGALAAEWSVIRRSEEP